MSKNVVIFHAACPDGAMAAAVALRALRARGEDAVLVPASYQQPLAEVLACRVCKGASAAHASPIPGDTSGHCLACDNTGSVSVAGATVYVLDFSFSPEETDRLSKMVDPVLRLGAWGGRVVVLDHHRSAVEKYDHMYWPNVSLTLDLNHSGAALAWKYFHEGEDLPRLIAHVEDYDLWRHALLDSKAVHAFLRSFDMDVEKYAEILDTACDQGRRPVQRFLGMEGSWLDEGRAILRANQQQAEKLAGKPEKVTFGGLIALAANAPLHQDDVGEMLAHLCESGVGVCWYWRDGRYKVSLRSRSVGGRDPFDCSALAAKFGGGGHVGAASFTCGELPWRERRMTDEEMQKAKADTLRDESAK